VTAKEARGREFTQFMADHILSDVDRYMAATIMDGDCVTNHLGENGAGSAPGAKDFLIATLIHELDFLQKPGLDKGPFFQRSSHCLISNKPAIVFFAVSKVA
jgi:hypothetical protein